MVATSGGDKVGSGEVAVSNNSVVLTGGGDAVGDVVAAGGDDTNRDGLTVMRGAILITAIYGDTAGDFYIREQ